MQQFYTAATALLLMLLPAVQSNEAVHEQGRCAMMGHCGKKSLFGGELNCPYNGLAVEPGAELRQSLVQLCGPEWSKGNVCCDEDQVRDLESNLKRAQNLISSCPACKENFYDFFCSFTCSPDQSTFVNVTGVQNATVGGGGNNQQIVTQVDYFVSSRFGKGFYNSCKDVKFPATNGRVMDLIGGGAKNYTQFFKFLGDEKPFGSPFQIDFPLDLPPEMKQFNHEAGSCASEDARYRCACMDCPDVCPELPELAESSKCMVGILPCLSFAVIILYSIGLIAFLVGWVGQQVLSNRESVVRLYDRSEYEGVRDMDYEEQEEEEAFLDGGGRGEKFIQSYPLNSILYKWFYFLGLNIARFPWTTIGICIGVCGLISLGWLRFSVELNPVRLWVSPSAETAMQKEVFDDNFGPFYRSEMAILKNSTYNSTVLSYDVLRWWFDVESNVAALKAGDVGLNDVCFKPTGEACVIQSVTGYWQGDFSQVDAANWQSQIENCVSQPVTCLPAFSQPLERKNILSVEDENVPVVESRALIATWVLNNGKEHSDVEQRAIAWENALHEYMQQVQLEANERGLSLSFSTEIALEQELNKSSNTDVRIVVISYCVMFLYVSLALGRSIFHGKQFLVESKFTLGLFGIFIVLISVSASVGMFSAFGLKTTLIIAEVIPFFVLAVGIDNVFLLTHELERLNEHFADEPVQLRIARTVSHVGPSILLSGLTETAAFAIGAAVKMPAVRNFAIFAAGAVAFDAILQLTMFPAALTIDQLRLESGRLDLLPFLKLRQTSISRIYHGESVIERFVRRHYAPFLLKEKVKSIIVVLFLGLLALCIAAIPTLQLGLDQRVALPSDSYLVDYFGDLASYYGAGPPVYFIATGFNNTRINQDKRLCGRFPACDTYSLVNILEQERKQELSYIADPTASWIDDFLHWIDPSLEMCCRVRKDDPSVVCNVDDDPEICRPCLEGRDPPWNVTMFGLPQGEEFMHYLNIWLGQQPTEECPISGKAAYSHAVKLNSDSTGVYASHFRTSHTALRTQHDYIQSYISARRISNSIEKHLGGDQKVFPYSVHYIYFEQYVTIKSLTVSLLFATFIAVFVISSVLLGSLQTSLLLVLVTAAIVIDVIGVMALWGVSLNAISLVNLIICVGIGIEFCIHIAKSFTVPPPTHTHMLVRHLKEKDERVLLALINVGSSVFTGITLTKFIGVSVLAFTRSKIFEIYYFRMWMALIVLAALHALVLLPVLLSLAGGKCFVFEGDDSYEEEWQNDASQRYNDALLSNDPLLSDPDD